VIVCLCKGVSDRDIRAARAAGAETVSDVAAATGAGNGCGCCHGTIARVLAEPCSTPCAGCPRAESTGAVPLRIAAAGVRTP
jgi:bacterioferritin-associated ferredoxin